MPLVKCEDCGRDVSTAATQCPNCGRPSDVATATTEVVPFGRGSIIGLAGSAILFAGVFSPAAGLPIVGSQTYFTTTQGAGAVLIALAVGAAVLAMLGRFRLMWIPGIAALGITASTYY